MAGGRQVKVALIGDASSLKKAFRDGENASGKWGSRIGAAAKKVALGLAAAGVAAAVIGKQLFDAGLQVEVWRAKVSTVFEGAAGDVRAWAGENAAALGLTNENLAGLAAAFGDLLKPMGFTADQAAEMSTEMLDLSGALSAWSGGQRTAAEVSQILAKAMLGETESLKELGISIKQSDIEARLATKGQEGLTGAALEQAKAIAAQELILEKSTDAQAAWANGTMDGVKASNELKAVFGEVKEEVALRLMPVLMGLVNFARDELIPFGKGIAEAWEAEGLSGVISKLDTWWDESAYPAISDGAKNAWEGFKEGIDEWVSGGGPDEALAAVMEAFKALGIELTEALGLDTERFESGIDKLADAWEPFVARFESGIERFQDGRRKMREALEGIGSAFSAFAGYVGGIIFGVINNFLQLGRAGWSLGETLFGAFRTIAGIVGSAFGSIISGVGTVIGSIQTLIGWIGGAIGRIGDLTSAANNFNPINKLSGLLPFAEGGPIPGVKGQPVPILAHGGEYMLDAGVVDAIKRGAPSSNAATGQGPAGRGAAGIHIDSVTVIANDPAEFSQKLRREAEGQFV